MQRTSVGVQRLWMCWPLQLVLWLPSVLPCALQSVLPCVLPGCSTLLGDEPREDSVPGSNPTESMAWSARIDARLDDKLREQALTPADQCDDVTFLRRVSLDLIGRNPTSGEVMAFLKDTAADKRREQIDRLLTSHACAVHLSNIWSAWLLPDMQDALLLGRGTGALQLWLRQRFTDNLRYDRLVADLLVASGSTASGPATFFLALEGKPEKIAAKTARVFLGVQLDCAECHDHPFDHWKQRDFWGFAAYFAQISADSMRSGPSGLEVSDRSEGDVKLPSTEEIILPQPLVATGQSSLESGSRRQRLTLWLTARENPYLARAAVNRVWSILFGRGLIEPIDDMRSMEMASHPQLLRELADEFSASGFDLRGLLRALANTRAYGRSSAESSQATPPTSPAHGDVSPQFINSYAYMPVKPLTSTQLATCLLQVAREIAGDQSRTQATLLSQQLGKLRGDQSTATLGMVQALVTLHSQSLANVHELERSRLLQALTAPHLNDSQRIEWMFLSTLARPPSPAELEGLTQLRSSEISSGQSTSDNSWQADLLWALINSTEFAMTP